MDSSLYPASCPTKLIQPGALRLTRIRWFPDGGIVSGTVGDEPFSLDLPTAAILDRKSFALNVWRFRKLLPILPSIDDWQEQIRIAEGAGKE